LRSTWCTTSYHTTTLHMINGMVSSCRTTTSVRASISVMTLLSTFETSCGCFSRRWLPSCWSPLNTLIPSVWSCLRTLALWSCIALPHWLGPLLKLRLSGTEKRPNRRRSNEAPRSVALLVLALLFALVFHHSSTVFQDPSFVYHSLKILKVTSFQGVSKSVIQTIKKTILLLFISVHVVTSIVGELCEASDILTVIDPCFRFSNSFFLSLMIPWCT
jgi:hypothetical protein